MENREVESGLELVLDNRKLIIAFGLLAAICGCFFVVGFVEGKRQGFQEGSQIATESLPNQSPDLSAGQIQKPSAPSEEPQAPQEKAPDQRLDWYNTINQRAEEPRTAASSVASSPTAKRSAPTPAAVPKEKAASPAGAESVTYSVQVGAFREKGEAELRSKTLREKGFDCRMEPPEVPGKFYLLKVGKFRTRAEAAAMQLRLKREGFSSFIKTN